MKPRPDRPFYWHAFVYTAASLSASAVNYIYYPIMARLMGVENYGELQLITSLILGLTTLYLSLNVINVNIVANHEESTGRTLMTALQKTILWLVVGASIILILGAPMLKVFFHFSSPWPFLLIVPILLIDTSSIFWTGFLQGHKEFGILSLYTLTVAAGKLLASVILVAAGLGVSGGVIGIALSLALGLLLVRLASRRPLPALAPTLLPPTRRDLKIVKSHLTYVAEVLVSLIAMGVLLSVDVLVVKHNFSPEFAGHYAGISTVARIIYFATAPLVMVMLPLIKMNETRSNRLALKRALMVTALICIGGLLVFSLASKFIIGLLMGSAFTPFANWLPLLSIIVVLFTLTNVMVNYLLALRSHLSVVLSVTSLVAALALLSWHHATIEQIVVSASLGICIGQLVFLTARLKR